MARDREEFFWGKLIARRRLSTRSFKGAEQATEEVERLAMMPEMRYFDKSVLDHELEHALLDAEVEGHITVDLTMVGITTRKKFRGIRFTHGQYHPEGRERTYEEMKRVALGVENPSLIDRISTAVHRPGKLGHIPDNKKH